MPATRPNSTSTAIRSSADVGLSEYVPGRSMRSSDDAAEHAAPDAPLDRDSGVVGRVLTQAREAVEHRALAGVRIADDGDGARPRAGALLMRFRAELRRLNPRGHLRATCAIAEIAGLARRAARSRRRRSEPRADRRRASGARNVSSAPSTRPSTISRWTAGSAVSIDSIRARSPGFKSASVRASAPR